MDFNKNKEVAKDLFHKHLAKFTNPEMTKESYAELFTEDAIQEYPYAPAPYAKEVVGRDAITEYISNVTLGARNWNFKNFLFSATDDPEVFFVEFEGSAVVIATGKPYNQIYIGRIILKENKIQAYREFWNPTWILDAFL